MAKLAKNEFWIIVPVWNPDPELKNRTYFDEFEYFATGLESPSSSKSSGTGTNPL